MDKKNFSTPINLKAVKIEDDFWKAEMELVRKEVIPYQWNALNDNVPGAAPSYCMRNFKTAGKITAERKRLGKDYVEKTYPVNIWENLPADKNNLEDRFYGWVFQDSDFAKWIEAVGYSLTQHPDPVLEKTADEAIDIVCAAQQDNGYLDTHYIINDLSKVFTDLRDRHELYCFGHLTEGAVAYYQATGKDKLLKAAIRYADYVSECFGPEEGKLKGYPGHEIAEMALVRLYEVTGDEKYVALSKFFIDERGKRPYYFDKEHPEAVGKDDGDKERNHYHQAHRPVREQDEVVGHSVRAVYLYSGMADIARITEDEELLAACNKLWDNMTGKKMYITGGIGATHLGEAFSFNYDLPNDTAYSETCAAIGLVFFARRMLEIEADRKYSDVMERALYNGVLSGMALDGKSFFYVNPLEVSPEACKNDARKFHVKSTRQKWFGCACCPPNIARLLSSVVSYAYTENEDNLFFHLYIGGSITKNFKDGEIKLNVESGLPFHSNVKITVENDQPVKGTLAFRMPGWGTNKIPCDFDSLNATVEEKNGYVYLTKEWKKGDVIDFCFGSRVRLMKANTHVREDANKLAVTKGPLVYCLEEKDNGKNLHLLKIDTEKSGNIEDFDEIGVKNLNCIRLGGMRTVENSDTDLLYKEFKGAHNEPCELTFVPYYTWNNRGEGEMQVWVPYI